jgi:hypothetical protein
MKLIKPCKTYTDFLNRGILLGFMMGVGLCNILNWLLK